MGSIEGLPLVDDQDRGFFRRVDWAAFWASFVLTFAVYFYTMCPTVGLEDSGELAVAGDYMGVPHPPGYPIWTFICWIFARVFSFVTFRGQPNPAWGITLVSVVFGALASGISAMLISRSGADMLQASRAASHTANRRTDDLICWVGGVVSSLLFSFTPVEWSQSVIVEVYSMNAFFLALIFLLTYNWLRRPGTRLLYVTAFVFGLGVAHYQVMLLAIVPLMAVILLKDIELFRDFMAVGILFVVTIAIMKLASGDPMPNFARQPFFASPEYAAITSHTPLLLEPMKYVLILLSLAFVVGMAVAVRGMWKDDAVPVVPLVVLAAGCLVLVSLLASVPAPPPYPRMNPDQEVFSWGPYYLAFAAAMVAFALLCSSVPRGAMLAVAGIAIEVTLAVLLRKGALLGLHHPLSLWFAFYIAVNFLFLALGWLFLPHGRTVAFTILMGELGVGAYVYMPIASDLRNPPMNWAYPRTWEGFKHAITRGQYEKIEPANVLSVAFLRQIGEYLADLRGQFTLPVALLGFLPFTVWKAKVAGRTFNGLYAAVVLSTVAFVLIMIEEIVFPTARILPVVYKFLVLGVILALAVGGLSLFVSQAREMMARLPGTARAKMSERITTGLVLLGFAGMYLLYAALMFSNMATLLQPLGAATPVDPAVRSAIISQAIGTVLMVVVPVLAVLLILWLMYSRHELRVVIDHNSQQWVIATLLGFLVMSVMLIALANPKGDIQDAFIQRVKFISSHALYSFWIGYGLIFGLAFVDTLFRGNRTIKWLSVATALALVLIPLHENASNAELLRTSGGAEQNGHDFGWQFGNYQLRGAEAITEELGPEEEPLPDPSYPPPMGTNAVFFGGTDPGRFVPTYMIYSARVREDVYLITQNALADNTYMSVMRDLYGDQIWIPAQPDSAKAFQRYVDEVNAGTRPRNAELKIENGRVQVSGALGVMEINGILAQMIFEYNNYKHDFYVEESYVIPWMYPYLTPHGLIMKINRQRLSIPPVVARQDQDFWDWYCRRLMGNPQFLRDVVARKSFSKLRSAIAGLYANTAGQWLDEAEEAFQQARLLYPLSPEANFRVVQEVLLRQSRFSDALGIMEDFRVQDPGNTKVPEFIDHLRRIEGMTGRIRDLERKRAEGQMDMKSALDLMDLYMQAGQKSLLLQMARQLLAIKNVDARTCLDMASVLARAREYSDMDGAIQQFMRSRPTNMPHGVLLNVMNMYLQANRPDRMNEVMGEYLRLEPRDWKAWIDQSALQLLLKQTEGALRSLEQAIRLGGEEAVELIRQDPRFTPIMNKVLDRMRPLMPGSRSGGGLPGLVPGDSLDL